MNAKSGSQATVYWWIGWIVLTIASFFVCSSFWTPILAKNVGSMTTNPAAPMIWVAVVFGSWMVLLVPLIVVMYQKVDKAYEDARMMREENTYKKNKAVWGVRSADLPAERRLLAENLSRKLRGLPETLKKGHLVHLKLKDGRRIEHAFILGGRELLGVYDRADVDFDARDVADLEPADLDKVPAFETDKWLRLDGVGSDS